MSSAPIARQEAGNDPYHWLENRDSDEVLAHLKAVASSGVRQVTKSFQESLP